MTDIIHKLGGSPQIYTIGIFMVKSLYLQTPNFLSSGTVIFFYQFLTKYSLNNNTLDLISAT